MLTAGPSGLSHTATHSHKQQTHSSCLCLLTSSRKQTTQHEREEDRARETQCEKAEAEAREKKANKVILRSRTCYQQGGKRDSGGRKDDTIQRSPKMMHTFTDKYINPQPMVMLQHVKLVISNELFFLEAFPADTRCTSLKEPIRSRS